MKRLFDPSKSHLRVWVWICDPESPWRRFHRPGSPREARATPLHYATFCGMADIATFLIVEHSQDVNACGIDIDGETPLHVASNQGDVELVQVLLEHGADIEAQDDYGSTPIHLASFFGEVELVQVLLEHGAEIEARDNRRCTPIHLASDCGDVELVQLFLKQGADAEARDEDDGNPLETAMCERHVEIVRVLLEHVLDANPHVDNMY